VLTPSLRVINSRTPNLCFRRPCFFLWFSIVSYNNYGGDSKLCFYKFVFLVRHPVAISVVTMRSIMERINDDKKGGHKLRNILACLPISKNSMDDQSHTYFLAVCLCNIPLFFFEYCIFNLILFNALCRWVYDPGGRPPNLILAKFLFFFYYFIFVALICVCVCT